MSISKFDYAGQQILGDRDRQEDAFGFRLGSKPGVELIGALADGIGGLLSGDRAAETAVSVFMDTVEQLDETVDEAALVTAVEAANKALLEIYEESDISGCTLVGFVIAEDTLHWVSVGDSYLWLYRDDQLQRLNQDHSIRALLEQDVNAGKLTEDEAREYPNRGALLSYLGSDEIDRIDTGHLDVIPGDQIIAASDGLEPLLENGCLETLLGNADSGNARSLCHDILSHLESLEQEPQDNASVMVVEIKIWEDRV